MEQEGKWGYSLNDEWFDGTYDTPEQARIALEHELELSNKKEGQIGQYRKPTPPESYIDAELVIDHILCQDEYSVEWAEDTFSCGDAEGKDLTERLQKVFVEWMGDYGQEPSFYHVHNTVKIKLPEQVKTEKDLLVDSLINDIYDLNYTKEELKRVLMQNKDLSALFSKTKIKTFGDLS